MLVAGTFQAAGTHVVGIVIDQDVLNLSKRGKRVLNVPVRNCNSTYER
jgi:hypothetical protein